MANVVTSSPESGSGGCPFAERPSLRSSYLANASQKDIKAEQEKSQTSTDSDTDLSDAKEDDGADIDWYPSFEEYTARVEMLSKTRHTRPATLPAGYPEVVNTPRAWTGSDFTDKSKYIYMLSEAEVKEIEAALSYFKALPGNNGPDKVLKETFPLPTLGEKLEEISKEVHFGRGFSVLRGLEPKNYSNLDNILIYVGISSYIGEKRGCQDGWGNMIIHITDLGDKLASAKERQSPYANNAQPFHTDVCDVLAMYVLGRASEGGKSLLASTAAVYNEIAATRPDVIHTLMDNSWIFDTNQKPVRLTTPLLFNDEKHGPFFCFSRRSLTGSLLSPRTAGLPKMTHEQAEALDMVHFTAEKHLVSLQMERGDMQFLNNLAAFHGREAFTDNESTEQKRHMLRLWLRNEEYAWGTPEALKDSWFSIYGNSERMSKACWRIDATDVEKQHVVTRKFTCLHG